MRSGAVICINMFLSKMRFVSSFLLLATVSSSGQSFNDFDQSPHDYWTAGMKDPMTQLLTRVERKEVVLDEKPGLPLVRRLLHELDIPVESQVLVFSRTSLQRGSVSPANPRAIFFNEESYLGWMPEGRIEIASSDPQRGAVFFFQRKLDDQRGKLFVRDRVCIQCHAGSATNFLPGLLAKSVYPDDRGRSLKSVDSFERVGHHVPISDRWGGWYVTGASSKLDHMGNAIALRSKTGLKLTGDDPAIKEGFSNLFHGERYPVTTSDVVALLVMDHQVSMHYHLMEASYLVRQALHDAARAGKMENSASKVPVLPELVSKALDKATKQVLNHLLFADEAPIGEEIPANGLFAESFLSRGVSDKGGRSLRDFELKDRIFRYRCSYMIYSKVFSGLPEVLRKAIYFRLNEVLSAKNPPEGYQYFVPGERAAILDILMETLPEFKASI